MTQLKPIKEPNKRGKGISWVYRSTDPAHTRELVPAVYIKEQQRYSCRPFWNGFRATPLVRRELRALQTLVRYGINLPSVIEYREEQENARLVISEVPNALPLDQALATHTHYRDQIIINTGQVLRRLHQAGWVHGALYPAHILIQQPPDCRVFLIDLEKADRSRRRHRDLDRLFRHLQPDTDTWALLIAAYRGKYPEPAPAAP